MPIYHYGAGIVIVNRPASIDLVEPSANTLVDASYMISWTASDSDNQASISLYYDTNNSGNDGTLITDSLSEGIHSNYTWNTASVPSGDYYVYAKIDDGVNTPIYDYGTGKITINRVPSIAITAPTTNDVADQTYTISWTANDPDNQATIELYYDTNNSGNDGTLITNSLSEGVHSSYLWDTLSVPIGDYYIYAKIDDGINVPIYRYGAGKVTVNRAPTIDIIAPASNELTDHSVSISWTASDSDNQASISLYYDTNNSGNDGTLITNSLSEGVHSSYIWNIASVPSGDYYVYAKIDDGLNAPVYDYGAGKITVNRPPSINITAPTTNDVADQTYTINWVASDSDNQASISLYYDTNNSDNDGTLITDSLSEGIHSNYTWNTASVPSGDYYVYAKIDDGVNTPIYDYGTGKITINRVPSIAITAPTTNDVADQTYTISWTASDSDNEASISLYHDTNNSGNDGTLIIGSLVEGEGAATSYNWNTSLLTSGDYYVYAKIDDGVNTPIYDYGAGKITVNRVPSITLTTPASNELTDQSISISWTASDSDNQASISLYYDTNNSGNNGTLITDSLSEGTHSSYIWDIASVPSGDYYVYAKIDDGVNTPVYDYGVGKLTINRVPNISIITPASNELADQSVTISWTASDPDNQATIELYYDTNNSGNDGTLIIGGLIEGEGSDTSYNWNTASLTSSDYYVYAKIDDGVNTPVYDYGAGKITVNRVPGISFTAPAFNELTDQSYTLSWTASDSDNQASISLYYDTNNSGNDGTLITDSLSEGIHSSYIWNTASVPSGDYYIYAKIDDGVNTSIFEYGVGEITVNRMPSITITAPNSDVVINGSYIIEWTANDTDNQASISLYYDTNNSGNDGTLITNSLVEGTHNSYLWDPSNLPEDNYYIYGKITDGVHQPVYNYANGKVTIPLQIKLNDTGIGWGGDYPSGNNTDCTGENEQGEAIIAQQDCSHGRDAQAAAGTLSKVGGGAASFDFTRLNTDGSDYTGNGDYSSQPWACVRDNHTGLVWEVKTDDGGIHDKDNTYRWGGKTALVDQQARDDGWGEFYDDWDTLVDGSNTANGGLGLCGFSDWRVPAVLELKTILHKGVTNTPIDSNYLPNTQTTSYWTSSPYAAINCCAWIVNFSDATNVTHNRNFSNRLRLVRSGY